MVNSVVREHHWKPSEIDNLYLDNIDYHGLDYWYLDVKEASNEIKNAK